MHLRVLLQSHQAPWCLPGFHVTHKLLLVRYFALVSFLKGYLSTGREFEVESERREELLCPALANMLQSSQKVKFLWACKRESPGTRRGLVIFSLPRLRLEKIMGLVGA